MFTSERPLWTRFHAKSLPVPRAFGHYESRQYRHSLPLRRRHLIAKKKILLLPARKKHPYLLALANPPRARAHIKLGKFFSGGEKFLSAKKSKTCHWNPRAQKNIPSPRACEPTRARARALIKLGTRGSRYRVTSSWQTGFLIGPFVPHDLYTRFWLAWRYTVSILLLMASYWLKYWLNNNTVEKKKSNPRVI